jgi:hypothetical protein
MNTRKIAALTGWLMVVTFVTSIPAYFIRYERGRSSVPSRARDRRLRAPNRGVM